MSPILSDRHRVAFIGKVNHQRFQHCTIVCRNYPNYNLEFPKSNLKNFVITPLYTIGNVNLT